MSAFVGDLESKDRITCEHVVCKAGLVVNVNEEMGPATAQLIAVGSARASGFPMYSDPTETRHLASVGMHPVSDCIPEPLTA